MYEDSFASSSPDVTGETLVFVPSTSVPKVNVIFHITYLNLTYIPQQSGLIPLWQAELIGKDSFLHSYKSPSSSSNSHFQFQFQFQFHSHSHPLPLQLPPSGHVLIPYNHVQTTATKIHPCGYYAGQHIEQRR